MPAKKKAPAPATPAKTPAKKKTPASATATAASTGAGAGAGNGCTAVDVDAHGANTMPTVGRKAASVKAKAEFACFVARKSWSVKKMYYSVQASATGPSTDTALVFPSRNSSLLNLT